MLPAPAKYIACYGDSTDDGQVTLSDEARLKEYMEAKGALDFSSATGYLSRLRPPGTGDSD